MTYTEVGMNNGIKEGELPEKFDSTAYQVLLVGQNEDIFSRYMNESDFQRLVTDWIAKKVYARLRAPKEGDGSAPSSLAF